ncbi:MAG: hypothetical protein U1E33_09175 [Rhodospirillales bacterium]
MRGSRLYVPRAALPACAEDEYYHADLIGLAAVFVDDAGAYRRERPRQRRARPRRRPGAGDRPGGRTPVLVPFSKAAVPVVDLDAGQLTINALPGLLEPAAEMPQ